MQQLLPFALNLAIVAWLRTGLTERRRTSRIFRWCVELGFGVVVALPLLT